MEDRIRQDCPALEKRIQGYKGRGRLDGSFANRTSPYDIPLHHSYSETFINIILDISNTKPDLHSNCCSCWYDIKTPSYTFTTFHMSIKTIIITDMTIFQRMHLTYFIISYHIDIPGRQQTPIPAIPSSPTYIHISP